jgi:hypothetical protein
MIPKEEADVNVAETEMEGQRRQKQQRPWRS